MRTASAQFLPPFRSTVSTTIATNVDILHFLANAASKELHDVESGKLCSNVVDVIDTIAWKVTGCPPMCGDRGEMAHSC